MLRDWLAHRAATTPERLALITSERSWTYAALDADATRAAHWLRSEGVEAGDRVATLLHNGPAAVLLVHALLRLHATLVPLNTRLSGAELAWQLADAAPRLLLVEDRTVPLADRARAEPGHAPVRIIPVGALFDAQPADTGSPSPSEPAGPTLHLSHDPAHIVAVIYTSGTTGQPKGAMLTAGNFWWSAIGSALNLGTHTDDRWLACLPLFHVGGLSIVLRSAIYGITAVVHDGFEAGTVNRAIDGEGITIVSVVAVMLDRMLDARGERAFPTTLRAVLAGGGPVPRSLLERAAALRAPVVQTYGLTETASQVATLAPSDALQHIGSAGRVLYPNEIRIVANEGDASANEAGEILVRGPVVMAGYHGRPDDTARAVRDGWLHTGDLGYFDNEGYLHVLDRRDDLIITGGENVYPAEVEAALLGVAGVVEAGVIGVADAEWGQRVIAIVRLDADAPPDIADRLRSRCRDRLAAYKVPREIRIVDVPLPRTASGQLQRIMLRERAASLS